jgi:hypothetical protein
MAAFFVSIPNSANSKSSQFHTLFTKIFDSQLAPEKNQWIFFRKNSLKKNLNGFPYLSHRDCGAVHEPNVSLYMMSKIQVSNGEEVFGLVPQWTLSFQNKYRNTESTCILMSHSNIVWQLYT